jgi:hypothetical protein
MGAFVGIGLPQSLAVQLAGQRPVLALDPAMIETAGLGRLDDAMVGCFLFGNQLDASDVIERLVRSGYRGSVTVVAPPLPDPRMVQRELESCGPSLTITLLLL